MKILTVIGARPQFIKAAALAHEVAITHSLSEVLVHTGQHYDANMSDVFFEELGIPAPAYHLGIGSASHGAQTGEMLGAIEQVIQTEQPDWLLVYGDTNSTLAGALAAAKLHVRVAHVEAGLRSFNKRMPEELNRILTDHVSDALFVPTQTAVDHLGREGIAGPHVHLVGDVMYDVALNMAGRARERSQILQDLNLSEGQYVLSTVHRAENTNEPQRLKAIVEGLQQVAQTLPVVLPLHPRTRRMATEQGLNFGAVQVVPPVGYLDMIRLEQGAALIATDSGGVQKEAYFYRVPCVTLRDETEWTELVAAGWNTLVTPTDANTLAQTIRSRLGQAGQDGQLYGTGDAARKILDILQGGLCR
ncbi:UDP-N-acetylglucosamine 2-epimerase [Deinococcus radiopugnans]|uniref:UDP-N-acetylglucosamine 2-epimerase n=1 Tax=Deinococcus radiopugnans TaxID=57497 RepID=A0A0A7KHT5_9DEIO|nr:UDP-N-acetylglucosamine 2-epimerase (non-hydrolyzing) [Deinococcus radiopugnans]AIZ45742.1 UDP-N-acetylglucosamine 2-epimerase [Deinococcus radiopugnans]